MNKFNLPQRSLLKDRRAKRAILRRLKLNNPSLKVPAARPQRRISGKQQRKKLKKWRRSQKEAIETGLVSLQDIEMMAVDNAGQEEQKKKSYKVHLKKKTKLLLKKSKTQGKEASMNEDEMMQ